VTRWIKQLAFAVYALTMAGAAIAQDTGATGSENWEDSSIRTYGTVPGSSFNVYIGSGNN
jgi:hypothetical protein